MHKPTNFLYNFSSQDAEVGREGGEMKVEDQE